MKFYWSQLIKYHEYKYAKYDPDFVEKFNQLLISCGIENPDANQPYDIKNSRIVIENI